MSELENLNLSKEEIEQSIIAINAHIRLLNEQAWEGIFTLDEEIVTAYEAILDGDKYGNQTKAIIPAIYDYINAYGPITLVKDETTKFTLNNKRTALGNVAKNQYFKEDENNTFTFNALNTITEIEERATNTSVSTKEDNLEDDLVSITFDGDVLAYYKIAIKNTDTGAYEELEWQNSNYELIATAGDTLSFELTLEDRENVLDDYALVCIPENPDMNAELVQISANGSNDGYIINLTAVECDIVVSLANNVTPINVPETIEETIDTTEATPVSTVIVPSDLGLFDAIAQREDLENQLIENNKQAWINLINTIQTYITNFAPINIITTYNEEFEFNTTTTSYGITTDMETGMQIANETSIIRFNALSDAIPVPDDTGDEDIDNELGDNPPAQEPEVNEEEEDI